MMMMMTRLLRGNWLFEGIYGRFGGDVVREEDLRFLGHVENHNIKVPQYLIQWHYDLVLTRNDDLLF
jgi:hypothetical protein